jgi:hypothetical protein
MNSRNVWERFESKRLVERARPVLAAASALGFIAAIGLIGVAELMAHALHRTG